MKVAVTGANGMVGANLVRMLVERGHQTKALVYGDTRSLAGTDVEIETCDILDRSSLRRQFAGAEIVIHLASAITLFSRKNAAAERVNAEGAQTVAEASRDCGVKRLVHFSSIHAFSPLPRHAPVEESRSLCGTRHPFPYDRSKAAGQRAVQEIGRNGLEVVVLHPTGIIGPHDYGPSQAGQWLIDMCHGRSRVAVRGGFDWVDVRDVCRGALAAAEIGRPGENYILSGNHVAIPEMCRAVAEMTGCRLPSMIAPLWMARLGAPWVEYHAKYQGREPRFSRFTLHTLVNHQVVSHEKATRELGFTSRPFLDTLRDALAWFRETGRLSGQNFPTGFVSAGR